MSDNSLRPETTTRDTQKCSACRQRRRKCSPHDRDWENSQQKCDYCDIHNLPCGPNLKYNDDPVFIRQRAAGSIQAREPPSEHPDESAILSAQNIPPSITRHVRERSDISPNPNGIGNGGHRLRTSSVKDLEEKARSKLHDFHAFGSTLAYISQPQFTYCHIHRAQQPKFDLSIEEKLHELFRDIYEIVVGASELDEPHLARWVLFALISALDQYRLCDYPKRHILLKIALLFQQLGHQWDCEHVLLKIASVYRASGIPSLEGPFDRLATSFSTSSMSIRRVLEARWKDRVGGNYIDANLNVPPLHTAVQNRQPSIIVALLSNPDNGGPLQLAPSLTTSSNVAGVRVNMEERDLNGRTALFAAVANGDESCCLALLMHEADANTRDEYGHTALEVAVRGGNLNIVKNLIHFNADVNPDITGCSSLPLHAAIESGSCQSQMIHHLLDAGAKVDLRRYADNKHAIDLAVDRGWHELAESMLHMVPIQSPTSFMTYDPSVGQNLS